MRRVALPLALVAGLVASWGRVKDLEHYRFFVTADDLQAMTWIKKHTPEDARFAVNTHFWLPRAPHGTDAGYWIPYFANRETTSGSMLLGLAPNAYVSEVVEMSHAVEALESSNAAVHTLKDLGVDYIYVGKRGDFSGPGLNEARLKAADAASCVYDQGGVSIFDLGAN